MLCNMFKNDFGDQVQRFTTLIDTKSNQFEVLVERMNEFVFFSKGWKALRDFYGISLGFSRVCGSRSVRDCVEGYV